MPVRLLILTLLLSSCSTFFADHDAQDKPTPAAAAAAKVTATDALELRVAQLWSRVDDLETQLLKQKERSKLLEKGLLLGIVPEELKADDEKPKAAGKKLVKSSKSNAAEKSSDAERVNEKKSPLEIPLSAAAAKSEGSQDSDLYRKMLEAAQNKFNKADYGQAIIAYNDIGAKFDDSVTEGSHLYWIGLSWFYLKEYKLSEETFTSLKDRYPSNPWSSYAAFYLAKIEQSRGLSQRALDQFQKILDENPDRDLGEMARAEIARMKEKL
ncbi:MAG: tetratricopeptide repeat protein [Chitinophagaceae bacterium]|nr:tetratricopeptide repeat protein [Oligoflexus sp.]